MAGRALACYGLAVLMAVSPVPDAAATQAQGPSPNTGLVVGRVVDAATERPIAGALVSVMLRSTARDGNPITVGPRILTSSDGYFLFRDLPKGTFSIVATKAGYVEGASGRRRPDGPGQSLTLAEGDQVGNVVIRMWKHAAISGTVSDEAGEPVVGVAVRAFRKSVMSGRRRFVAPTTVLTDDRGVYRIGSLIPGEYVVAVPARLSAMPPHMAVQGPVHLPWGSGPSNAILVGEATLVLAHGTATPPPPAGDRVSVYPTTFHPAATHVPEAVSVTIESGEERGAVDLQLNPVRTARVSGFVSDHDGPLPGAQVQLLPAGMEEIALDVEVPVSVTDRGGAFTFPAVPPGQYLLHVVRWGRLVGGAASTSFDSRAVRAAGSVGVSWAHLPLTAGGSDITGIAVTLQSGLRVSGSLAFEGATEKSSAARLQQVPVILEPVAQFQASNSPWHGRVEGNGQFTTAGVPAGKYFVRVGGSPQGWMFRSATYNGVDLSEFPVDVQRDISGVVITFTDRWTGIRGTVRSRQGEPDAGTTVLIFPTDPDRWTGYGMNPRRIRSVRASANGEFGITSLPAGVYHVVAIAEEAAGDWQDPRFLEAAALVATQVTLTEGDQRTLDLRTHEVR